MMIPRARPVNNAIYESLGERWYEAKDDPVALLRAESTMRNPWVAQKIRHSFESGCAVLDVGCGGGFLSNYLAELGYRVTGIDASERALEIAAGHDASKSVDYHLADATSLPFSASAFSVVCAMDFLEHVEDPQRVITEAARVLSPDGLLFFHTFNRNWLSWLVAIKGVEWFIKNTPKDMHVLRLFLKPEEVVRMCRSEHLEVEELLGSRPSLTMPFWKTLASGNVHHDFKFIRSRLTHVGYMGVARKRVAGEARRPAGP